MDEHPDPEGDLVTGDAATVGRRVVAPVLEALFRPGEVEHVDVRVGPDRTAVPEHLRRGHLGPEPGLFVWLSVVAVGETYERRICEVVEEPENAEWLAADLHSDLQDFIAESRFGWGEQREGDWSVPPV
ncbi:MAG: hypothetical protein HY830_16300 [Actinobacteria bacterium]|nr:hypothetical protein [Actinomycetota bacterium]